MMTKFYVLENCSDLKIVGKHPQTISFEKNYNLKAINSAYNVKWNEIPIFDPNLDGIIVHSRAKMTDFISFFLGSYSLISKKAIGVMKNYNLPPNKISSATLHYKDEIYADYYCFFYESQAINLLNLNKSIFAKQHSITQEESKFKVSNLSELKAIAIECVFNSMELNQIKTVLKKEILDTDLFNLDFLSGTHVSERLGNELLKQGITGLSLTPVYYEIE